MSKSNKTQRPSSSINDQATTVDLLGFEPYVKAVAKFLTNPHTKPPLTMSIEGSWGSGKSSFMLQLDEIIRNDGGKTVRFNAWRHDKAEALWAAFALDFIHQLPEQSKLRSRIKGYLKLQWLRFTWRYGWLSKLYIVPMLVPTFLTVVIIYLLLTNSNFVDFLRDHIFNLLNLNSEYRLKSEPNYLIAFYGAVVSLGIIFSNLKSIFGNSLNIDLNKCLISPNYESHTDFIRTFHNDFSKIVSAYADQSKVYVFIDDLDRCDVSKSAELMQAINILIANDPNLIFIIGMDRMKVAAGLATKNEKILPYIYSSDTLEYFTDNKNRLGLKFGYEFLEKFIQFPFSVPQPEEEDVKNLLDKIHNEITATDGKKFGIWRVNAVLDKSIEYAKKILHMKKQVSNINDSKNSMHVNSMLMEVEIDDLDENSSRHDEIIIMVFDTLKRNPRRLKQFINIFRLKRDISKEIGLFQCLKDSSNEERWNYEKLGKFVAITIRWPLLVPDLVSNRTLISDLQKIAFNPLSLSNEKIHEDLRLKHWSSQQNLMDILKHGCFDKKNSLKTDGVNKYSIGNLNFDKLLKISPISPPLTILEDYEILISNPHNVDLTQKVMGAKDKNVNIYKKKTLLSEESAAMEKATLDVIRKNENGIHQNDLWKELNIDSRKCSRIVKELHDKGQITRESAIHNGARSYLLKYKQNLNQ